MSDNGSAARAMSSKISVVDDKPFVRELLQVVLEGNGGVAVEVHAGDETLKVYEKDRPDMVLLDFRMSGNDGLEILRSLKAIAPEARVIVVNGTREVDTVKQKMNEGAAADNPRSLGAPSQQDSEDKGSVQAPITLAGENPHAHEILGGRAVKITSFPFRIGREGRNEKAQGENGTPAKVQKNDLDLDDPRPHRISRSHFQVERRNNHFFVRDTGSRFGLLVNGRPIGALHRRKVQKLEKGKNLLIVGGMSSPYRFTITV